MEFTSKALQKARTYETEKQKEIPLAERPDFHVTPPVGWLNDPNGFSFYQGEYHLFCQYHPYDTHWGPMHWMHKKSQDLITWETLPAALAPDETYDAQGCFSGTAIEDEGRHVLLYTGVQECVQADGSRKTFQTQNIAIGDGTNYQKLPQNPVIRADLLPEGSSVSDFRDPKIWKEQGRYYAAVGSLAADGSGQIALFSAERLDAWKFETILDSCKHRYGCMWECPDFFPLDGKQVLLVSPQFMKAEGLEFHSGNNAIYLIGDYQAESLQFSRKEAYSVDYGLDFYAPQTVEAPDGRRILIGWLQSWDNYLTPSSQAWSGLMSIPRELSIRDGRLIQTPVRELSTYHGKSVQKQNITLQGGSYLSCRDAASYQKEAGEMSQILGIQGRQFDMTLEVSAGDYERFELALACGDGQKSSLFYEPKSSILTFDRSYSGMERDLISCRSCYVRPRDGAIKLRIVMDKMTVEVFVNDGEQVMSHLVYTDSKADGICFGSKGSLSFGVNFHELTKKH